VERLRARPYATLTGLIGVGWMLGRAVPPRVLLAVAWVSVRGAVAAALEGCVRDVPRRDAR
jgi:hypothetical protein